MSAKELAQLLRGFCFIKGKLTWIMRRGSQDYD